MEGVVRTRAGYAGGKKENPTYYSLGDHTETLQIDFNPERITYEELLHVFWSSHNPVRRPWSRQYMSIIFYHNQEQEILARVTKTGQEEVQSQKLYTEVKPFSNFYLAEDYHQKYYLQNNPGLMPEVRSFYANFQDFVDSTAAARINGYVAGYGDRDSLAREIELLGLSSKSQEKLKSLVR